LAAVKDEEFSAFVRVRGTPLLRFATLLAGNPEAGEDLLQEVLEKVYRRWTKVGQAESPEAYIRRALVNSATKHWARRRRRDERLVAVVPEVEFSGGHSVVLVRQILLQALSGLSRQQRAVIVLRYFADQSEAEVARLLGCSVGNVKSHASRGLERLRNEPELVLILDSVQES
jgi:RNA polymerase sigma-70 factor (sigma-E family)